MFFFLDFEFWLIKNNYFYNYINVGIDKRSLLHFTKLKFQVDISIDVEMRRVEKKCR